MNKRPKRPIRSSNTSTHDLKVLDTPERIVEYCKSKNLIDKDCIDIIGLIKDNEDLELVFEDLGENDAYIKKIGDSKYRIAVHKGHPPVRQRFSMAHEYIHYQMHRTEIENMAEGERILHRNEERNPIEYQANRFAAEILMPEEIFGAVVKTKSGDVEKIAQIFQVSTLAVRYRAKTLGYDGHGV